MKKKAKKQNNSLFFSVVTIVIILFGVFLFLSKPPKPPKKAPPKKIPAVKVIKKIPKKEIKEIMVGPRIAFVIDDWGYSLKNEDFIKDKGLIFTLAVLPNLKYSRDIARLAKINNKDIILHLPLEPKNKKSEDLETRTIVTGMNKTDIRNILKGDLKTVPYIKGISNHMGSRATEDSEIMAEIFSVVKEKRLYFLDSRSTQKTVCRTLSKKKNIKFAERSVFLDNRNDAEYIKNQILQLIKIAKTKKIAIGIGHDRPLTLQTIKDMLPELKKQGIKLIFVSEIFKQKS